MPQPHDPSLQRSGTHKVRGGGRPLNLIVMRREVPLET